MSDQYAVPDGDRPVLPEDDNRVERTEIPSSDAEISTADLPETQENDPLIETQENDPLIAALGENGQGDLAPEDEPDVTANGAPIE